LWTEDPTRPLTAAHAGNEPVPHPFSGDVRGVIQTLSIYGPEGEEDDIALLLPSSAAGPSPSPFLWLDVDELPPAPDRLRPWSVVAAMFAGSQITDALAVLSDTVPPHTVIADDLACLIEVWRFAEDLVARGQVMPSLRRDFEAWEARWVPRAVQPADAARRRLLIEQLPPVLRSSGMVRVGDRPWEEALVPDRAEVVDAVLRAVVDPAVRHRLKERRELPPRTARKLTAWEAFRAALEGPDAELDPRATDVAALQPIVAQWAPVAAEQDGGGLRAAFRVTAPPDDDPSEGWRLEVVLQAVDDPTLIVDAATIWRAGKSALVVEGRVIQRPQERLLADLGRAARRVPQVAALLKMTRPSVTKLTTEEAWSFLRQGAIPLAQLGLGVLAPPWWNKPRGRLARRMKVRPKDGKSAIGLQGLVQYEWRVAIGDAELTEAELRDLAARRAPLVQMRGQWIELRQEDIDAALAFYNKRAAAGTTDGNTAMRIALGLEGGDDGLPISGVDGEGWMKDLFTAAVQAGFASQVAPAGFRATLRGYQERGLGWLAWHDRVGLGACLADDMGLGKTVQMLALLVAERQEKKRPAATLLVCPTSVVGNWQREAERFAPGLKVVMHHGAGRRSGAALAALPKQADLVLTSYGTLVRDREELSALTWGRVVLDEAQNVKNADTAQAKAVRTLRTDRRVALTGTPVENRLSELWALMDFLNPGLLGSAGRFRERYALPIERDRDADAASRLKMVTGPFILRRLKTDKTIIQDLPEKIEIEVPCTLTREQAALYRSVVDDLLEQLKHTSTGIQTRGVVLSSMMKLKQICDHPALLLADRSALPGRSGKLERLEEILEEVLAQGEKALVFTQFTEMGHPLKAHLQERFGREVLFLHGGTTRAARDAMVARFEEKKGPPIFVLSLRAGGTGLNLVAANHVVHFDRWWNPAVEDQASDRAFRIGQDKRVQVRKLLCLGTVEEKISKMIADKRALAGSVVDAGEAWLADLSATAIRDLVRLETSAIEED
jgi:hypothetical protein